MMEHLTQGEYILVRLSPAYILALSEGKNVKVEILGQIQCLTNQSQSLTIYQSTEIMNEKTHPIHYLSLTGTLEDDMWIIDSGASRRMKGDQVKLSSLNEKKTSYKVELGDKNTYPVKGIGQTSIKLKSGNNVHSRNVLYVPGLEKNIVSIYFLEDKGNRIAFVDGEVLSWSKDSSIENVRVIGTHEGRLYRLVECNYETLIHDQVNPNELLHRRYAHLNYQALPFLEKMVEGIPEIQSTHEGISEDAHLVKMLRSHSQVAIIDLRKYCI
jgi:hypothetical protein